MPDLSFSVRHDFRQPLPHAQSYADYYEECIEEVRLAESLGFDGVWVTEHHFWDDGYLPSSFGMLAALARETSRMRLGTSVVLLPLYHPLRVAEDATLVDLVSGGRLILGLGLGYASPGLSLYLGAPGFYGRPFYGPRFFGPRYYGPRFFGRHHR